MNIAYNWVIGPLECYVSSDGLNNVVHKIYWRLDANSGDITTSAIGSQDVTYVSGSNFTPFENLTKDIVESWIVNDLGVTRVSEIKSMLENDLISKLQPTSLKLDPPWFNQ